MSQQDYSYSPTGTPAAVLAQESANVFMAKVYRWMVGGLALTGVTSWVVASNQALAATMLRLFVPLLVAELVCVLAFSFIASRVSGAVAALLFLGYAFLNGLTFSIIFLVYELGSIASVFAITAVMFGALSIYATTTKRDLSGWGTFLFMGLIGIIAAGVVNLFIGSGMLQFVIACAGVVIFAGLTAYDTQKLRAMHASSGFNSAGALAIVGALILYLDFVNLFLKLLQLFGRRR